MTQVHYRRTALSDVYEVNSDRAEREAAGPWKDAFVQKTLHYYPRMTYSIVTEDQRVVGLAGAIPAMRGSAEVYTILDNQALSIPSVPRLCREIGYMIQEVHEFRRIHAMASDEEAELLDRWLRFIGLEYEATLKSYDRGIDYHVYARVS